MAEFMPQHRPKNILVTGGMGFIGSNLIRHLLSVDEGVDIYNLDCLTYAGNPDNLGDLPGDKATRHHFINGDITDSKLVVDVMKNSNIDTVIHLAAESHVDRSIDDPLSFVKTNVMGTAILLHSARGVWKDRRDVRFHHVSTDEVFGSLPVDGYFTESTPYDPSSPYSASKAASDHLVRAWFRTYSFPVTLSNCSNNYGPYHFPEKLIPLTIFNALKGHPLPIYGDGQQVRDWLYVEDHVRAIERIVKFAPVGSSWNVGGKSEWKNLELVKLLCSLLEQICPSNREGGYLAQITFVRDRPGHDFRYAMDSTKLQQQLGWQPRETIETGLKKTIAWYLENPLWAQNLVARHKATARRGLQ